MIVIEALDHIKVPASDLEKSLEFYTMVLDFEKIESKSTDEYALITFDDKVVIKLVAVESANPGDQPLLSFILDVDDFTEALQDLEKNGDIEIVSGPNAQDNGENILIKDPAGNILELYYVELE